MKLSILAYKNMLIRMVQTGEISHRKAKRMFDKYTKTV